MDRLSDPLSDRAMPDLTPPPHRPISHHLLFPSSTRPDWRLLKDHLAAEGRVDRADALLLIDLAVQQFRRERNLLELKDPVSVVGDIHGQYHDFIKILDVGGNPETTKYLFLGDFVDRGNFSVEVILLLFSIKVNYPNTIFIIRGNHECRQMTTFFNFREECIAKYDLDFYDRVMDCFDTFPIGCLVNKRFLAVHGGISPELESLSDVNAISRFSEPPKSGVFCDLLWADPVETENGSCPEKFRANDTRGCSFFFSAAAVNAFLRRNKLLSIIRAHEAQLEGYKLHKWNGPNEFPAVITVFSAPNYCDVYNNKGAIIKFENNTLNIQQYNYTAHPYILPDFMDIFSWSVPFVTEKILGMLMHILSQQPDEEETTQEPAVPLSRTPAEGPPKMSKREILRNRVLFVGKMARMQKNLREQNESLVRLKGLAPDNKIPRGLLSSSQDEIQEAVELFSTAKQADSVNEKRPDQV